MIQRLLNEVHSQLHEVLPQIAIDARMHLKKRSCDTPFRNSADSRRFPLNVQIASKIRVPR